MAEVLRGSEQGAFAECHLLGVQSHQAGELCTVTGAGTTSRLGGRGMAEAPEGRPSGVYEPLGGYDVSESAKVLFDVGEGLLHRLSR